MSVPPPVAPDAGSALAPEPATELATELAPRPGRRVPTALIVWCVVAAVVAGLAVGWARVRTRPVTVQHTVHVDAPGRPLAGSDCPDDYECSNPPVPGSIRVAMDRHFPGGQVFDDFSVRDFTGVITSFRVRSRLKTGTVVTLTGRCVRDGVAVPGATSYRPSRGPAVVWAVAAGGTGCSTAVVVDVRGPLPIPADAMEALVHDTAVRLQQ
ncbi:MAG: hypothetical protein ABJA87_11780 [bacterium]